MRPAFDLHGQIYICVEDIVLIERCHQSSLQLSEAEADMNQPARSLTRASGPAGRRWSSVALGQCVVRFWLNLCCRMLSACLPRASTRTLSVAVPGR